MSSVIPADAQEPITLRMSSIYRTGEPFERGFLITLIAARTAVPTLFASLRIHPLRQVRIPVLMSGHLLGGQSPCNPHALVVVFRSFGSR